MFLATRVVIPLMTALAILWGPLLPSVMPEVREAAVVQTPQGQQVTGKVGDFDFQASIDRVTSQPGKITRIEISTGAKGGYRVVAEYTHERDTASDPTAGNALRAVHRWLETFRKKR